MATRCRWATVRLPTSAAVLMWLSTGRMYSRASSAILRLRRKLQRAGSLPSSRFSSTLRLGARSKSW